jgi:hypothetical protein
MVLSYWPAFLRVVGSSKSAVALATVGAISGFFAGKINRAQRTAMVSLPEWSLGLGSF